jgi:hypothetical protein
MPACMEDMPSTPMTCPEPLEHLGGLSAACHHAYVYVDNNPLRWVDPTGNGRQTPGGSGALAGCLGGGAMNIAGDGCSGAAVLISVAVVIYGVEVVLALTRSLEHVVKELGLDYQKARKALENTKRRLGIPASDDVMFDPETGEMYHNGEPIGNLEDETR